MTEAVRAVAQTDALDPRVDAAHIGETAQRLAAGLQKGVASREMRVRETSDLMAQVTARFDAYDAVLAASRRAKDASDERVRELEAEAEVVRAAHADALSETERHAREVVAETERRAREAVTAAERRAADAIAAAERRAAEAIASTEAEATARVGAAQAEAAIRVSAAEAEAASEVERIREGVDRLKEEMGRRFLKMEEDYAVLESDLARQSDENLSLNRSMQMLISAVEVSARSMQDEDSVLTQVIGSVRDRTADDLPPGVVRLTPRRQEPEAVSVEYVQPQSRNAG